jgi:hypothetical protein
VRLWVDMCTQVDPPKSYKDVLGPLTERLPHSEVRRLIPTCREVRTAYARRLVDMERFCKDGAKDLWGAQSLTRLRGVIVNFFRTGVLNPNGPAESVLSIQANGVVAIPSKGTAGWFLPQNNVDPGILVGPTGPAGSILGPGPAIDVRIFGGGVAVDFLHISNTSGPLVEAEVNNLEAIHLLGGLVVYYHKLPAQGVPSQGVPPVGRDPSRVFIRVMTPVDPALRLTQPELEKLLSPVLVAVTCPVKLLEWANGVFGARCADLTFCGVSRLQVRAGRYLNTCCLLFSLDLGSDDNDECELSISRSLLK